MNKEDYTYLLQNPKKVDSFQTNQLEEIINEYPYFQSARALQLKGLNLTNSFKYNHALKKTAAYTIDRKVLFEFITSQNFINNSKATVEILEEIEVIEPEIIEILHKKILDTFSNNTLDDTSTTAIPAEIESVENALDKVASEILEIGKPLKFNITEPHSFNEWMQLISKKTIKRDIVPEEIIEKSTKIEEKFSLIDRFIESNPKINPLNKSTVIQPIKIDLETENESLMTETLAKVYLEQQKYESAIKAYHILSLKYPEKSSFFADRIKAIKILQNNKS
ncbi:hypothetical protein EC396_09740 [Lutibacter sp. HS1-25]|uniref:hypothetical protein n=1 Tax=Lutibacter sp. HS1-25 TaxID=2485000 RepID=UPI001012F814|nr:hypothetical protein [Lutibacter sp. HS1-25]RXP54128.1 hypothetical protein EC396_09740 [Lutibacter sp. HS1-25]